MPAVGDSATATRAASVVASAICASLMPHVYTVGSPPSTMESRAVSGTARATSGRPRGLSVAASVCALCIV